MKNRIIGLAVCAACLLVGLSRSAGGDVTTSNLVTATKERVLRVESLVPAPPSEVWKRFSTEEGLKKWVAPVVALDLRTGGSLSTHYDKTATIGSSGTIRLGIEVYLENELMVYKVNLTEAFSAKPRAEDQNLQEIIQIQPWTNGTTRVVSSMVGWGAGPEWDKTYNFFAKGNAWSYEQLVKSFTEKAK
jgi:uncharacterized protein YndB with AHSA1/START domain